MIGFKLQNSFPDIWRWFRAGNLNSSLTQIIVGKEKSAVETIAKITEYRPRLGSKLLRFWKIKSDFAVSCKKRNGGKFIKDEIEKKIYHWTREVYDSLKPNHQKEEKKEKRITTNRSWRWILLLLKIESPKEEISEFGQKRK